LAGGQAQAVACAVVVAAGGQVAADAGAGVEGEAAGDDGVADEVEPEGGRDQARGDGVNREPVFGFGSGRGDDAAQRDAPEGGGLADSDGDGAAQAVGLLVERAVVVAADDVLVGFRVVDDEFDERFWCKQLRKLKRATISCGNCLVSFLHLVPC
jgi:hypothetical protein